MTELARDELLSLAMAARRLGVAETTIVRLIDEHGLPAIQVGYGRRIWADELEQWVADQPISPADLVADA